MPARQAIGKPVSASALPKQAARLAHFLEFARSAIACWIESVEYRLVHNDDSANAQHKEQGNPERLARAVEILRCAATSVRTPASGLAARVHACNGGLDFHDGDLVAMFVWQEAPPTPATELRRALDRTLRDHDRGGRRGWQRRDATSWRS
jgi:hypothetical protein